MGIAVRTLQESVLFDVEERIFLPLIYGEGKAHVVHRLRKEIADAMSRDDTPNRQGAMNHVWMVPFERNPFFTGRESELKVLRQALFTGHRTAKVAVTGPGGVGKTQLVLGLVYQIRAEHKNCSVIWIPVTSKESLGQAYLNAARQLSISGCEDDKADIRRLVRDHLSSESAGQWLLVFDNADDVGMWVDKFTPESGCLIDCLPRSSHGSIIFTTRDMKTAVRLAGRNVVEMSEMDEAGGKQLIQKYLVNRGLSSQEDATTLLARLTYLPLAIIQAAVYINANGISLGDYLSLLEEQEEDVIDLLNEDFEDEGRYRDVKNAVATTWFISFEQIRCRDPLAADYLSFMACVDTKDIPQSLLPPGQSRKKETQAIGTLQGYSFVTKRSADSTVNIQQLVHLAMRNWLRKEGLLPDWTCRAIFGSSVKEIDQMERGREDMRAETRQCRVPLIESGQGLILGHLGGTGFGPPPPRLELKQFLVCGGNAPYPKGWTQRLGLSTTSMGNKGPDTEFQERLKEWEADFAVGSFERLFCRVIFLEGMGLEWIRAIY
ncbi:P-loop containing nucleoside triphosphate hydrolase protein [Lasiosphaeria miniovina]|uniref:P-loop containing nucleoside triphosphate hydrolase protein n=1 Tax=Lasiosphaeria miniovina TaxID=1954250 RepID=A0AA40A0F7_9PEZI|nr:P-loop containing nucleoside triphosphate hydrolase protein [Lasiosphaeria miniovina]KAK0707018.1 P-loop containing nucleoside triphosphate hydrolase protein [Lasiosphaeria miniovina]